MKQQSQPKDLFSRLVNWFSSIDDEKPTINREGGGKDYFSKLMNYISD